MLEVFLEVPPERLFEAVLVMLIVVLLEVSFIPFNFLIFHDGKQGAYQGGVAPPHVIQTQHPIGLKFRPFQQLTHLFVYGYIKNYEKDEGDESMDQ